MGDENFMAENKCTGCGATVTQNVFEGSYWRDITGSIYCPIAGGTYPGDPSREKKALGTRLHSVELPPVAIKSQALNPVEIEHKTSILGEMYDGMGDFVRRGAALAYIQGSFEALLQMKPDNLRKEYLLEAMRIACELVTEVMPHMKPNAITVVEGK